MTHFTDGNDSIDGYEFSTARHNDDFQDYRNAKPIAARLEQLADECYEGLLIHDN